MSLSARITFVAVVALLACGKSSSEGGEASGVAPVGSPVLGGGAGAGSSSTNQAAKEGAANEGAAMLAQIAAVKSMYNTRCALCHGYSGRGDGPSGGTLSVRPTNFSDKVWQQKVDDLFLARVIREGGRGVGKSPLMPANPDLTAENIRDLVGQVRSFRQP